MDKTIKGKAFVLGDNVDTDQIIPAEHLVYSLTDAEESKNYGRFSLSGVPPSNSGLPEGGIPFVREGNYQSDYAVVIAGSNFGCGSSREHAPFAMQVAGTKAVIAESYARIFYRNSVDGGFLLPFESSMKLNDKIKTGDELELDVEKNILKNLSDGKTYNLRTLGDILPIIEAGNIFEYARKTGMMA
jgi:3-isopropylmalate/(R)-2-methylmalate dehydratase small subunit